MLKEKIIIFMACCFFKLQSAFIVRASLLLETNEISSFHEKSKYRENYLHGKKNYIWDGEYCRLKHASIVVTGKELYDL